MRSPLSVHWFWLMLTVPAHAAEPVGELLQLRQLDRASQQELRDIQSPPQSPEPARPADRDLRSEQLNRRQTVEQGVLQENQRRDLLLQKQGARNVNQPASSRRLDAIGRQRQFRLQQQNQLNRFRIQQGTRKR